MSPLTEYWMARRNMADLPVYADFDPLECREIMPDLLVLRVCAAPLDFEYSLVGSNVREIHSENRRGQRMSAIDGQGEGSRLWSLLANAVAQRDAVTFYSPYSGPLIQIDAIKSHVTPWTDKDGNISRLVIHVCRNSLDASRQAWFEQARDRLLENIVERRAA